MAILILPGLLCLVAGCASHQIETYETELKGKPEGFPRIHLAPESIRCRIDNVSAPSQFGTAYTFNGTTMTPSLVVVDGNPQQAGQMYDLFAERRMYDSFVSASSRSLASSAPTEYDVESIKIVGTFPDQKVFESSVVRITSFFIPPMAYIKTHLECPYSAEYTLSKNGQIIHEQNISGTIHGFYAGWYAAGALEGKKLGAEMEAIAEREITVKIVDDLYGFFESEGKGRQ